MSEKGYCNVHGSAGQPICNCPEEYFEPFKFKSALDEAQREIDSEKELNNKILEKLEKKHAYFYRENIRLTSELVTANALLEKIRVELGNQIRYYDASLPLAVRRENAEPEAQILSSLKGLWEEIEQHRGNTNG